MNKDRRGLLKLLIGAMIIVSFVMVINVIFVSVFKLHVRSMTSLDEYVTSVNYIREDIYASRGNIYDANGITIAQDKNTYSIICYMSKSRYNADGSPAHVEDIDYTANVLANLLGGDAKEIAAILESAEGKYQTEIGIVGRQIDEKVKEAIEEYELPGVDFVASSKRYYPLGDIMSPYLVGFAQDDAGKLVGKMGVEQYLNDELSGIDGYRVYQADEDGYVLPGMTEEIKEPQDGYDVYLTLDNVIQEALETALEKTMEERNASRAWGAVVEIDSGKILAWGQSPSYDPNKLDIEEYNNFGSQTMFEPGSVFKSFAYAAAMEEGVYDGTVGVDSGNFCFVSNGTDPVRTYSDDNYGCLTNSEDKVYGWVEYDYGLIMSLNTVTASIVTDLISPDKYLEYLYDFGFFQRVDTDGIRENVGSINFSQPVEKLTATYGAGLTVNMLELIQAYTAIFGNGEMIKPYFIERIVNNDTGSIIYEGQREVVSTPISEDTAKSMQDLLRRVVTDEAGTAKHYEVEGLDVMAKTGTQQILDESGIYIDGSDVLSSVILAFPYDDPQYMIYYAFESAYDRNNHYYTGPITELIERVGLLGGLTDEMNTNEEEVSNTIVKEEMPNLKGQTLEEAKERLDGHDVVVLGDGATILDQYPKEGSTIYSNHKIYLLTSTSSFTMPDLTGWSRKEVTELWSITGVPFTLDGYGVVTSQSIAPGEVVSKDDVIMVTLEDLKDPNASSTDTDSETIEE